MLFGRRVAFAIVVLAAQLLLIALAIAWCVHMVLIAKYGQIFFVEANPVVLHGEIGATVVIILFGLAVFVLQCKRLGERRGDDDRERGKQG